MADAPSGAVLTADADDHEEAAFVEGMPESVDDDAALAWGAHAVGSGFAVRSDRAAAASSWRRAPARQKCARGPPAAAS